jgi:hypothetical protein
MYQLKICIEKQDGGSIVPYMADILQHVGGIMSLRAEKPGFVSITRTVTLDGKKTVGVATWENEEAFRTLMASEENDEFVIKQKRDLDDYVAENNLILTREYETV